MTTEEKLQRRASGLLNWYKKILADKPNLTDAQYQKRVEGYRREKEKYENEVKHTEIIKNNPSKDTGYGKIYKKWLSDEWKDATTGEMMALVVLVAYNAKSGRCYLGMRSIARLIHTTEKTVQKYIARLEEKGIIEISKKGGANNLYRIVK
jgi:hypothetical protein